MPLVSPMSDRTGEEGDKWERGIERVREGRWRKKEKSQSNRD